MNTLTATFVKALPEVTGQGKNGEWRKTDFIIYNHGSFNDLKMQAAEVLLDNGLCKTW